MLAHFVFALGMSAIHNCISNYNFDSYSVTSVQSNFYIWPALIGNHLQQRRPIQNTKIFPVKAL